MQEIWKDIPEFEGLYQVSNLGRIKNLKRNNFILSPYSTKGYQSVKLSKNGKATTKLVHRLVAQLFVPNPNNYNEVNHKDENKANNVYENLEWCTRDYNMSYGTARVRQGISCGNPIEQLTVDNIAIARYCSAEVACKLTGIDSSSIIKCCINKRTYAGGYKWKYIDTFS